MIFFRTLRAFWDGMGFLFVIIALIENPMNFIYLIVSKKKMTWSFIELDGKPGNSFFSSVMVFAE